MPATRVGVSGLGKMGSGMAANLMKAGFAVRGLDVHPAAVEAFVRRGGAGAASPAEAAREAAVLAIVVHSAAQVDAALFGEAGALMALPRGATVVVHSTVSPAYVAGLAQRAAASGHLVLDAPVSGGAAAADDRRRARGHARRGPPVAAAPGLRSPRSRHLLRSG